MPISISRAAFNRLAWSEWKRAPMISLLQRRWRSRAAAVFLSRYSSGVGYDMPWPASGMGASERHLGCFRTTEHVMACGSRLPL